MRTYQYLLILVVLTWVTLPSTFAQKQKEESTYNNELTIGFGVHTRGFHYATIAYNWMPHDRKNSFFHVDFVQLKSARERRNSYDILSVTGGSPRSFIYGKQNSLFATRLAYGEKHYMTQKSEGKAVSLAFVYSAGMSLGLLKPYYLNLVYRNATGMVSVRPERYTAENYFKFLDPNSVDGAAGFAYGWDEVNLMVGGYVKAGLLFDWGADDAFARSLEIGLEADFYFREVPLMVVQPNSPVFVNLYANIQIGKRW